MENEHRFPFKGIFYSLTCNLCITIKQWEDWNIFDFGCWCNWYHYCLCLSCPRHTLRMEPVVLTAVSVLTHRILNSALSGGVIGIRILHAMTLSAKRIVEAIVALVKYKIVLVTVFQLHG